MLRSPIIAATCVALGSCGQSQPGAPAQLAGTDTPRPGAYEVSQLQYALGASAVPTPQPTVSRVCVSAVDAQHPQAMIGGPQLDACPERHVTLRDGHIDLEYRCVQPTGSISGNGSYSTEGWEMAVDVSVERQSIRFEEKAHRTGDC
jgi:Protein of unknown function (DUF3617)